MIRPLRPDDAVSLYGLLRESSPVWCDHFGQGAKLSTFKTFTEEAASNYHRLVASGDSDIVGLGILKRLPRARLDHSAQISLLFPAVETDFAAGKELLQALIDLADNWLNLTRLEAALPTFASDLELLLRQQDFQSEGLMTKTIRFNGDYFDERAFARLRNTAPDHQLKRPPMPLSERKNTEYDSSKLLIRQMEIRDIDQLYLLFRAPENCRTTMQLPSQEPWLTRQRVLNPPPRMIRLVAEYEGRVVGMISLRPRDEDCRSHVGGIGMMVHPDFWRLGIGSRLMEEMIELADEELHLKRVELQVHTDNPAGIRLYEKSGFVIEGTKHYHSYGAGGWSDTHFMARVLE